MASEINPDLIDPAYPVAGQDNSTQGFRSNFAGIKTNFEYAEQEINNLQNSVILKSAIGGGAINNNFGDNLIYAARVQDFSYTKVTATGTAGTITINYSSAHYWEIGASTGSITLEFAPTWPASGAWGWIRVQFEITSTAHTLTLPAAVSVNTRGIQGFNTSTNVMTFAAPGVYELDFETYDSGSTITVTEVNKALQPFNNSSEDLASATGANLAVTTSYFSTAAAETATLAAGVEGQIKVFAMYAKVGNMVITVTNAGWKTSGNGILTFDTIGDSCIMQYINGKWFCIGNNGATFA